MTDLAACPRVTTPCEALSERGRAEAAEEKLGAADARLAEAHNAVARFLDIYGNSTSASHQAAISLAWQVRKILAGKGLEARERIAAGERERLLGELARRKVTVTGPATVTEPPEYIDMVPWAVLEDILRGLPTAGCEEVRGHG